MTKKSEVLRRWQLLSPYLHRKQQTVWVAAEAEVIGPRGCPMLASVTGISIPTLTKWVDRLKLTETARAGSLMSQRCQRYHCAGGAVVRPGLGDRNRAAWIACQMREGVAGMSRCRTPSGVSAFIRAFMMVAGAAMAPA
jgi:hypothetical protein